MKLIPLSKQGKNRGKYFAMVDDVDYERVINFNWHVVEVSSLKYASSSHIGLLHRFILGITDPKIFVDHKDGNGLNCQRNNIRKCTSSQNQKNKKPSGTSKYLGVFIQKVIGSYKNKKGDMKTSINKYWRAEISINGTKKYIGLFKTEYEAAMAYDSLAKIHHGEFANLNFKR